MNAVELSTIKTQNIRALAAAGFTLIPLYDGKSPGFEGWRTTPHGKFGPEQLRDCNYGVALRAEDVVLDVDPRNFKPGDNSLARLVKDVGAPLNATFVVRTGGGGLHVYLKKPADFPVRGKLKNYPGIDIRTLGGQMVGPGSVHMTTKKPYTVAAGRPDALLEAPAALLALLKKDENFDTNAGTSTYQKDEGSRTRFVSYLTTDAPTSGSFAVACRGRDLGLPPEMTLSLMLEHWNPRRTNPRSEAEMKTRVAHAYKYAKGALGNAAPAADFTPIDPSTIKEPKEKEEDLAWDTTAQGLVKKSFVNLLTFMRHPKAGLRNVFGYNEFTGQVVVCNPAPWHKGRLPRHLAVSDTDLKQLKAHLAVRHGFEIPVATIEEAVVVTARNNKFHPVREYLESLVWDGKPRLDTWLIDFCGVEDSAYTRAVSRKVLCAAVMRVFKPGCKYDHVLILEGDQGIGKSSVVKLLGGEWSGDFSINPHDKDTIQLMQGQWLIELAELEFKRRSDDDAIKAFITRQTDKARLAYGRLADEYPRQCIFIATVNPGPDGTFLKDDTGLRRWWPVRCAPALGQVDFKGLKEARNQLFAEAVVRAKAGEKLFMETAELKAESKAVASKRHAEHEWTERIATWVHALPADRDFLTARDVYMEAMGGIDKGFDRKANLAIASVMRGSSVGWRQGSKRMGRHVSWGYLKPEVDGDDVLAGLL